MAVNVKNKISINDFIAIIENRFPIGIQEGWDNSGIQINLNNDIKSILVALELTDKVLQEACNLDVDLILTHHPLFFKSIKKIDINDVVGRYIKKLVQHNISLYSAHTNFDIVAKGNNDYFGELLGFPQNSLLLDEHSLCRMSKLKEPMTVRKICDLIMQKLDVPKEELRLVGNFDDEVQKIGWCTGAGTTFIDVAKEIDLDLFITGDVKYHDAQNASESKLNLLDIGHFSSEKIFTENIVNQLNEALIMNHYKEIKLYASSVDINPFKFIK